MFVRFAASVTNARGTHPGVFALVNGLRAAGRLTDSEMAWVREASSAADKEYADPSRRVPGCYDRAEHPGAAAWYRASATAQIAAVGPWLDLLDRHGVPWVELRSADPGRIVYADDVQVVAVPVPADSSVPM